MVTLGDKFTALGAVLRGQFKERDQLVAGMLAAALAGEHVLLLGPPGSAKSALARAFCGAVDGSHYFEWLLSKFTAPEELFGPLSLSALKLDKYTRVTTGKLPEAEVVFLDEIFKANSGVLNSLLSAINERVFHNNGTPTVIPLRMVVGASNELPEGAELAALYDRFLCRYWVEYIQTPDNFAAMLMGAETAPAFYLTLEDWDQARAEVEAVKFSLGSAQALYKLRQELASKSIHPSDRRWKRCVKLAKAQAWLDGDAEVHEEHMLILTSALWDQPEQLPQVAAAVGTVATGTVSEAVKVQDMLLKLIAEMPPAPVPMSQDHQNRLIALNREGNRAVTRLKDMAEKARTTRQKDMVTQVERRIKEALGPVRQAVRESLSL